MIVGVYVQVQSVCPCCQVILELSGPYRSLSLSLSLSRRASYAFLSAEPECPGQLS